MIGVRTIFDREIASYFTSLFAYLIAAAILLITGILFINNLGRSLDQAPPNPAEIPNFFAFALIFFAPLLTMRLLAEERREGTMELLLTSPTSDSAAKWNTASNGPSAKARSNAARSSQRPCTSVVPAGSAS